MLQLSHIYKSYNKVSVLEDTNYIFNKGQIYPVLGSVGSGRTTLFECISGDLPIDSGEIKTKAKATIFFAAKQSVFPLRITGYQYLSLLCDMESNDEEPDAYFDKVGISVELRDKHIGEYTFEEKKRLQLAAFLIQKPYVILFDEPFDYCSEEYIDDFLRVLEEVKDEHVIIISTGLLDIAQKISSDVVILNNGELNQVSEETMAIPEIKDAVLDILGEADNEII